MSAVKKDSINLLVVANPATPELSVLEKLPAGVKIVATGQKLSELSQQLSEEQWGTIEVALNCGVGKNAGKREDVQVASQQQLCSWQRPFRCCSVILTMWRAVLAAQQCHKLQCVHPSMECQCIRLQYCCS